jgi:hypothetical protein
MTTTLPTDFPPGLKAFIDAVSADEKLQAVFTELFAQAGDEAGEAALIARATEAGAPISAEDIDVLLRTFAERNKEKSISDEELDVVGGGGIHGINDMSIINNMARQRVPKDWFKYHNGPFCANHSAH